MRAITPAASEADPAANDEESYIAPLNHGSIPDWDSDYEFKMSKIMRNIPGDNFKPKKLRPKKKEQKRVRNETPYSDIDDSDMSGEDYDYNMLKRNKSGGVLGRT